MSVGTLCQNIATPIAALLEHSLHPVKLDEGCKRLGYSCREGPGQNRSVIGHSRRVWQKYSPASGASQLRIYSRFVYTARCGRANPLGRLELRLVYSQENESKARQNAIL